MITEHRALQHNLLKQFNKLIGKICCHECLDCDCNIFWILCLTECCLYHLINEWTTELIILLQNMSPKFRITTLYKIASLRLEQTVLIAYLRGAKRIN